jgi:predicted neuraminidase
MKRKTFLNQIARSTIPGLIIFFSSLLVKAHPSISATDGYDGYTGTTGGGSKTPIMVSSAPGFKSVVSEKNAAVIYMNRYLNVGNVSIDNIAIAGDNPQADNCSKSINEISETNIRSISTTIQEGETGFCEVDGSVDDNNSGFTGDGFANTDNETGNGIDWKVNFGDSETYTITWRFANGKSDRPADLIIDGTTVASDINFASTGSWTTWDEISVDVSVNSGIKDVRLEATGSGGLANIDYIEITGTNPQAASCQAATLSASPGSLSFGDIVTGNSATLSYTLNGANLTEDVTISATAPFTVSTSESGTYSSSISITPSGSSISQTIYVKFTPSAIQEYSSNITNSTDGVTSLDVSVSGTGVEVLSPSMAVEPTSLTFGSILIENSSILSYTLTGSNITPASGDITISAPSGFEVSTSSGSGFSSSISVPYTESEISQTIYVMFSPTAEQSYSGSISNSGGDASTQYVTVSGSGVVSQSIAFSGIVTDFDGNPISGATVTLKSAGNSTSTADDGSFALSNESTDEIFDDFIVVSKTDYLDYEIRMYNQPEASDMLIRMASADYPVWSREHLYDIGSADFPECHASSIVELEDGTLLSVYFGGSDEGEDDVEVRLSRKEFGQSWEAPIALTDAPNDDLSVENPNIFQDREGKIFIFWSSTGGSPNRIGMMMTSTDGGVTWSDPRELGNDIIGPEKNKCVQLEDGTILCPTADRNGQFPGGNLLVVRSFDGGETWEGQEGADDGDVDKAIQPTILFHSDGRIQMMARGSGKIPTTWSSDNGETWSALEKSILPGNWSGVDGVTLRDGRQFLVYNHVPTEEGSKGGRDFLNLAVSDDGVNWSAGLVVGIGNDGQFSYPAIIQSRDGLVHITHTWHRETIAHVVINPYKITDDNIEAMPDGEWPTSGALSRDENEDKNDDAIMPASLLNSVSELKNTKDLTDIAENNSGFDVNVFPNPVNTKLNIEFSKVPSESAIINLLDISGKPVTSVQTTDVNYSLNISDLPNGLYLLKITGINLNKVMYITKY